MTGVLRASGRQSERTEKTPAASRQSAGWLPLDLAFLTRPVLLGPVWVIYGAGALIAGGTPGIDLFFVSLLVAGVYVHNQLCDEESDRINRKLFIIADGHVDRAWVWIFTVCLWTAAILWAALHGNRVWLYLLALGIGLLYNAGRPAAWKNRPWLGLLANGAAHGSITFIAGYHAVGGDMVSGLLASLPYAAAVCAVYLGTTLVDARGDAATGKHTFGVAYGYGPASVLMAGLVAAAAIGARLLDDHWMAAAAMLSLPAYVFLSIRRTERNAQIAVKWAVVALALVIGIRWPVLFVLAIATFFASRVYYRMRFGLRYPNITPDPSIER
jgi:4-hydroxybenzoate polyprenyltransferase